MMKNSKEIKPIAINPGSEVTGNNFFGRDKELKYLSENMKKQKASFIIPGPRRWGKSSFIKEFMRRNKHKYSFCYLHLQRTHTIKGFYNYILDTVQSKNSKTLILKSKRKFKDFSNLFTSLIGKIKVKGIGIETGNLRKQEPDKLLSLAETIIKHFPEKNIILVLDEISDFLNEIGGERAILFLKWLRSLRQAGNVQMIMTGSININATVRNLESEDLINDLQLQRLEPMNESDSITFLKSLMKSVNIEITDSAHEFCSSKISDGIHYFIQVFADMINKEFDRNYNISDKEEIKNVYTKLIESNLPAFSQYHTRIDKFFDRNVNPAKNILIRLTDRPMDFDEIFAFTGELISDNKKRLNTILQRLIDEGYIKKRDGKYTFLSVMLSDYWKQHFYYEK
ncbi:MAG: ATP-binding protein [Candidatus Marinimicrobia bacterium]|nr:ATP-binding protein [Candidatus Neomarinimicrobiota bacterium]